MNRALVARLPGLVLAIACVASLAGCSLFRGSFGDLKPAAQVDLTRYMGHWRVVANIPYFAEDGCFDSIESYALRADGDIDNWFSCRKKSATAKLERQATAKASVVNRVSNAEWNVRFFKLVPIKYVVVEVDPEYQWAVVGHPSRKYGWIFSRSGQLPDATYQHAMTTLASRGYDISQFVKVPQSPEALIAPPFK